MNIHEYSNMRKDASSSKRPSVTMESVDESFYDIKARTIAVLANPKRLHIVDLLSVGERTVSELATALELPQATTSQHLAVLRKAGGVMSEAILGLLLAEQERLRPVLQVAQRQRHA